MKSWRLLTAMAQYCVSFVDTVAPLPALHYVQVSIYPKPASETITARGIVIRIVAPLAFGYRHQLIYCNVRHETKDGTEAIDSDMSDRDGSRSVEA